MAAAAKKRVATADIGAAYLNADLDVTIHMKLNKEIAEILVRYHPLYTEFIDERGCIIVELKKSLYGCKQSSLQWYNHMKKTLQGMGYTPNIYDECVFEGVDGSTILLYVDDLMIFANSDEELLSIIDKLKDVYGDVTFDIGIKHSYLGMTFVFEDEEVRVNMDGYINSLTVSTNGTSSTPAGPDLFIDEESTLLSTVQQKELHTIVAKLLFLATRVRPDILLVVNYLTTRVNKFTSNDLNKCNKCLKYLNKTKNLGLVLAAHESTSPRICGMADASFGVHSDSRSQSASASTLGSGSFYSSSHKQKLTTKSSTEAELVSAAQCGGLMLGQRNYLLSRGFDSPAALLGQDNKSTIQVVVNGIRSAKRLKHLDNKIFFLKDYVEDNQLLVKYIPTNNMIADVLTKPLPAKQFIRLRDKLLGYDKVWLDWTHPTP